MPWRSEAALSLRALGRCDEAVQLAEEELALARRFGAPRALGHALRAAAAVVHGDRALELARESVAVPAGSQARLEHARALVDLGERLRTEGSRAESRTLLREALDLSSLCGASALEQRALHALRAAGARPRRARLRGTHALAPSELRIAEMAARGMSNRQIAEAIFVTVRTVEFHLGGAYRKLRIGSRHELGPALSAGDWPGTR